MAWYTKPVNEGKGALALANKALHAYVLEDERAIRGMATATAFSHNAVAKSKEIINEASAIGRDAAFTAKRTWGATEFTGRSIGIHVAGGAAVGAGLGAGNAYMNHEDPIRGGIRGGLYGAGAGLVTGAGRSLGRGYAAQAETRLKGYASAIGPRSASDMAARGRAIPIRGSVWSGEASGVVNR